MTAADLFDQHQALLDARAVSPAVARDRGYSSTVLPGWLRQQGFSVAVSQLTPGMVIPVYDVHGDLAFHQYRPDKPRTSGGKTVKYETPKRTRMVLDVPRSINGKLADPAVPLFITESPLKADAAVSAGLTCIATFGVFGWRGTNNRGGKVVISDFEYVALNGRTVYLVPDSDVATNANVGRAVSRLGGVLERRGADVRYVYLPRPADGSKLGLDDYLAAGGTVDGLYELADDEPPEKLPSDDASPFTPGKSPATVQPDPPQLALAPRILDLLAAVVVALGVAGERTVAATTYLTITSRLLDKQASLAVKGHSASGKSYTVEAVVGLFPPEAVCIFTGMSERALIYSEEQYTHRTIVLYEAAALREKAEKVDGNQTAYFLRSLLSEGRISYDVVVRNPDGGFTARKIVKEGPTNLVLTTTAVHLHGENETRMLSMNTNDSQDQTRRVLAALADETVRNVDVAEWRQLQAWLAGAEHRVTIPYAGRLAELVPPLAVRLRRDFGTFLALIRAHAILHQLNRERDADGRIIASLDDYEIVRDLVGPTLAEGVAATVSPTIRATVEAVAALDQTEGVTSSVLAVRLDLDKSAAYRRLQAAAADGYVQNLEDRRGRPGRWRTAAELPEDVDLLPGCNRLQMAMQPLQTPAAPDSRYLDDDGCTVARDSPGVETCTVCGDRLDPVHIEQGFTTHPGCDEAAL